MRFFLPFSLISFALIHVSTSIPLTRPAIKSLSSSSSSSSSYTLSTSYTSANFFDAFTFFSDADPTQGHVTYQTRVSASEKSLAGMLPEVAQSPIYLGTDHTSQAPNGRASVRVQSTESWLHGLFIFDIAHMPTGCGTWPAVWLLGAGAEWPLNGEIDILEGVNDQVGNRMTLHTNAGCSVSNTTTTASSKTQNQNLFTGTLNTGNCDVNAANQAKNAGCQIANMDANSYGTAFNEAGGGVYAVEWTTEGISIWFFSRKGGDIPSDLAAALSSTSTSTTPSSSPPYSNSSSSTRAAGTSTSSTSPSAPNPRTWRTPQASFAGPGCDFDTHFQNQSIIINTSLCGDWAGAVWSQSPTCASKASTCDAFVSQNPGAFEDAFWAVNQVQVWQV